MTIDRRPVGRPSTIEARGPVAIADRRTPFSIRVSAGFYDPDASSFDEASPREMDDLIASSSPADPRREIGDPTRS